MPAYTLPHAEVSMTIKEPDPEYALLENTILVATIARRAQNKPLSRIQARESGSLDNHEQNPLKPLPS